MTSFVISGDTLKILFNINQFELPTNCNLIFVGIRACLPEDTNDNFFKTSQTLLARDVDYKNMRCTVLQWKVSENEIAAFAASTVPSYANIIGFRKVPPRKSNCLTSGFYKNYVKGKHRPANIKNHHDAFRQSGQPLAIRRTYDNTYYDNFDTIEISTGCDDNIHAGWTLDAESGYFSSAGCQVIMGLPFCESTKARQTDNQGPWKVFKDNAYAVEQTSYPYALFNASEVQKIITSAGKQISARLKFGSSGEVVKQLQTILINMNYLSGTADGDFGTNTFNGVKKFQTENFGVEAVDCVVGPVTSQALGLTLPTFNV